MFDKISTKYGKPSHYEKTDKDGYPYVYYANWVIGPESVSLEIKADSNYWIYKNNNNIESKISLLELRLHLYSKKGDGKVLDF